MMYYIPQIDHGIHYEAEDSMKREHILAKMSDNWSIVESRKLLFICELDTFYVNPQLHSLWSQMLHV